MDTKNIQSVPPGECVDAELLKFMNNFIQDKIQAAPVLIFPPGLGKIFRKNVRYFACMYNLVAIYIGYGLSKTVAVLRFEHLKKFYQDNYHQIFSYDDEDSEVVDSRHLHDQLVQTISSVARKTIRQQMGLPTTTSYSMSPELLELEKKLYKLDQKNKPRRFTGILCSTKGTLNKIDSSTLIHTPHTYPYLDIHGSVFSMWQDTPQGAYFPTNVEWINNTDWIVQSFQSQMPVCFFETYNGRRDIPLLTDYQNYNTTEECKINNQDVDRLYKSVLPMECYSPTLPCLEYSIESKVYPESSLQFLLEEENACQNNTNFNNNNPNTVPVTFENQDGSKQVLMDYTQNNDASVLHTQLKNTCNSNTESLFEEDNILPSSFDEEENEQTQHQNNELIHLDDNSCDLLQNFSNLSLVTNYASEDSNTSNMTAAFEYSQFNDLDIREESDSEQFVSNLSKVEDCAFTVQQEMLNFYEIYEHMVYEFIGDNALIVFASENYLPYLTNYLYRMHHIIEVYGFSPSFHTSDVLSFYREEPRYLKWCDNTHALLVTSSPEHALRALRVQNRFIRSRPLADASPIATVIASHCNLLPATVENNYYIPRRYLRKFKPSSGAMLQTATTDESTRQEQGQGDDVIEDQSSPTDTKNKSQFQNFEDKDVEFDRKESGDGPGSSKP